VAPIGRFDGTRHNESETKYMIASQTRERFVALGRAWLLATNLLKNDVSLETQRRIKSARRCFFKLRKQLQSKHFSRRTKFIIYKTLIRPVLLYGSETWVLTKREENQYLVFERKELRTICGPKQEKVCTCGDTNSNSDRSSTARESSTP
jgi:hypothetical protein